MKVFARVQAALARLTNPQPVTTQPVSVVPLPGPDPGFSDWLAHLVRGVHK